MAKYRLSTQCDTCGRRQALDEPVEYEGSETPNLADVWPCVLPPDVYDLMVCWNCPEKDYLLRPVWTPVEG